MSEFQQFQHGLRSVFAREGDDRALDESQRSRLAEIRAGLATPDGVHAQLQEHAAKLCLIFEWGVAWLEQTAQQEGAAATFSKPMLARFFTAAAEARRALETLARVQGKGDGAAVDYEKLLEAKRHGDNTPD